jgi:hypothetical protein
VCGLSLVAGLVSKLAGYIWPEWLCKGGIIALDWWGRGSFSRLVLAFSESTCPGTEGHHFHLNKTSASTGLTV